MSRTFPAWLKIGYSIWLAVWIPAYWLNYGPANFLWLCDVANLVLGAAILLDSALLFSSQAVSVLFIQFAWIVDYGVALVAGFHPIGGTEYMFDPDKPLWLRALSLFHVVMPPLLLWGVRRLGYDRRGWKLQCAIAALVLPLSYLLTAPTENVNWLWRPFGVEQTLISPPLFVVAAIFLYPLVLYLPTHALLVRWSGARRD